MATIIAPSTTKHDTACIELGHADLLCFTDLEGVGECLRPTIDAEVCPGHGPNCEQWASIQLDAYELSELLGL